MEEELFSIGEFSKLCSISIQALRYYDKINILKPKYIDKESQYRFYCKEQILRVKIIQKLQELGFSLDEVRMFLDKSDLTNTKLMFEEKKKELEDKVKELIYSIKDLQIKIDNIDIKDNIDFSSIEIKRLPDKKVAYLRKEVSLDEDGFTLLYNEFQKLLSSKGVLSSGNFMAIFYGERKRGELCDIEFCVEIEEESLKNIHWKVIKGRYYLRKMHLGEHKNKADTYKNLKEYAAKNKLNIVGDALEIYYIDASMTKNLDELITEIYIPVENVLTL